MKMFSNLLSRLRFFQKYKWGFKASEGVLCRSDVLHDCYRTLVCLNSKFDELKNFIRCVVKKNATIFWNVWNFFSNVKKVFKKVRVNSRKTDSCITVVDFWRSRTGALIKYWHINCYFLWKMFPIYCRVWNFFENVKEVLKTSEDEFL